MDREEENESGDDRKYLGRDDGEVRINKDDAVAKRIKMDDYGTESIEMDDDVLKTDNVANRTEIKDDGGRIHTEENDCDGTIDEDAASKREKNDVLSKIDMERSWTRAEERMMRQKKGSGQVENGLCNGQAFSRPST